MAHVVNPLSRLTRRDQSGVRLHAPPHERPVNDNFKPTVSFQYLQLLPMTAIFLAMVLLLWLIAIAL